MNTRTLTVLVCVTALIMFVIGAAVRLSEQPDHGVSGATTVGTLLTAIAPLITTLLLLIRQDNVKSTVDDVKDTAETAKDIAAATKSDTSKILNGEMNAKLKSVMHEVLNEREQSSK